MRWLTVIIVAAAVCGMSGAVATAQSTQPEVPPEVSAKWTRIRAHAERQVRTALEARDQSLRGTSISAAADAVDPAVGNAAATVQRLAGAIKTNPEGTEAGLVVAPFALAGADWGRGIELTFAALKADATRLGGSYTWATPASDAQLWSGPKACPVDATVLEGLDTPREFFLAACTQVVRLLDAAHPEVRAARISCGLDVPAPTEPQVASLVEAVANIRAVFRWADRQGVDDGTGSKPVLFSPNAQLAVAGMAGLLRDVGTWQQATPTSCYSDAYVKGYFQQLAWDHGTLRVAGGAQWDLFPLKSGFSPDGSELPRGETQAWLGRIDVAYSRRGTEFSAGVGIGESRAKLADPLKGAFTLSTSVARAFSLLSSARLRDGNGGLNVIDGEPPPRLVLGLTTSVELATSKPDSQESSVNKALIQPYVDFVINDTLAFRLGIPIKAETVVRDAKAAVPETPTSPAVPAITEKRALQWTVPVAIVAVLKL